MEGSTYRAQSSTKQLGIVELDPLLQVVPRHFYFRVAD